MNNEQTRVLLLQSDLDMAQVAIENLRNLHVTDMECVANGIECIACFEAYRPHLVFIDANGDDMPVRFIVQAMNQLDPSSRLFLWTATSDKGAVAEAQAVGAQGTVQFPLDEKRLDDLLNLVIEVEEAGDDETIRGFVDDSASLWNYRTDQQSRLEVEAAEINQRKRFQHKGDLKVVGNLRSVELLEVSGTLEVQGNVVDSHVRCRGDMIVNGGILDCGKMGIFARRMLDAVRVKDSMVVCGGIFLLSETCEGSIVNVAGRMIGKSRSSVLAGGKTRVGEHLMIGILGDEDGCETEVELASNIFFQHWVKLRKRLFQDVVDSRQMDSDRRAWFDRQIVSRNGYLGQADLCAQWIYPGVKIRIGETEEVVVQPCAAPVRVHLTYQGKRLGGIAFERRNESLRVGRD